MAACNSSPSPLNPTTPHKHSGVIPTPQPLHLISDITEDTILGLSSPINLDEPCYKPRKCILLICRIKPSGLIALTANGQRTKDEPLANNYRPRKHIPLICRLKPSTTAEPVAPIAAIPSTSEGQHIEDNPLLIDDLIKKLIEEQIRKKGPTPDHFVNIPFKRAYAEMDVTIEYEDTDIEDANSDNDTISNCGVVTHHYEDLFTDGVATPATSSAERNDTFET